MSKSKGGRPKFELTDEQIKELEVLASNMTIEQIAGHFGISETTFYEIKKTIPEVHVAYKKGKAAGIKEAAGLLWQKMRSGDTASIIFYLKTQAGWSEKQQHDVTSNGESMNLPPIILQVRDKSNI